MSNTSLIQYTNKQNKFKTGTIYANIASWCQFPWNPTTLNGNINLILSQKRTIHHQ